MSIEKGVTRSDFGRLNKPEKLANGFMRADGYLSRAGIFRYVMPDGTVRRELRPEEEVFHADALKSFAMVPVTDNHPPANLTAENAKEYQRGAVSETLRRDGDLMRGSLMVTDSDLVAKMERGDAVQASCGYTCDLEMQTGEYKGEKYDAVQTNIRGNHVAIVPRGRAGDGVRVRMDARDAAMVFDPGGDPALPQEQSKNMKTFRHDGVSYEGSEQVAELVEKLQKERTDAIGVAEGAAKEAATKIATFEAKADALTTEVAKLKADAAIAPEKIRKEINTRMVLETGARQMLGKEAKFDGMSDREVRVAALTKFEPKFDIASKGDEYVAVKFDMAVEATKQDSSAELEGETAAERTDAAATTGDERLDAMARNAKFQREQWKQPVGRHIKTVEMAE